MIEKIKRFWLLFIKILKFEFVYKLGIIIIITPLFNKIIQIYLNEKSHGGAFNLNIVFDFLNLQGILIILLLFIGTLIVVGYEISVLINIVTLSYRKIEFRIYEVMKSSLLNLKCLKNPSFILAGLYFLLLLPLVHIGYLNSFVPSLSIPNFVTGELQLTIGGNILIIIFYLFCYGLYLLLLFVPVIMILKHESFIKAFKTNLDIHRHLTIKQRLILLVNVGGFVLIEWGLGKLLSNAIIKNSDFNRFFLRNLIISSRFRIYLLQYLITCIALIVLMIVFYLVIIKIVDDYDSAIVTVNIDNSFNQAFDETVLEAKIHGNIIYQSLDKYIFQNNFYQKHWGVINIVFWSVLLLVITYLFPNSIYILCMILIVVIIMYFIASIINRYEQNKNKQTIKESKSWLFLPYRIINNILNRSKIYNRYPRLVSFVLIGISLLIIVAYLEPATMLHQPWVIGHRGSRYGVENTYSAIAAADENGADYAEIDVQLSSDDQVMVVHDNDLSRLAGVNLKVNETPAKQLTDIEVSQNGYTDKINTLDQIIEKMKDDDLEVGLLVELKTENCDGEILAQTVIEIIEENDFEEQAIFMSLDYDVVSYLQQVHPEWWVGYCIYGSAGDLDISLWNLNIDFLAIEENRATVNFIEKANYNITPVYVWTVDTTDKMLQYLDMGVSGIITNYPNRGKTAVNQFLDKKYRYYYYQDSGYPKY